MNKPELEKRVSETITHTLELLEEAYISYHLCSYEELRKEFLPFGEKLRVTDFVCMILNILKPLMELAKKQWPDAQHIIDWAEEVATKLMASAQEEE